VQLREQDWGNFQAPGQQTRNYEERLKYGRFFFRFPEGESAADVYDRMTM
jgi:broad specificity phosphatase PhoE